MKLRTVLIVALAVLFALPAVACGPMPSGGMSTTKTKNRKTMSDGRDAFTKRRIKELKEQMHDYRHAQRVADKLDFATGNFSSVSPAEKRRYMINRYEFLALKAERGHANANDIAEMRALQQQLMGR